MTFPTGWRKMIQTTNQMENLLQIHDLAFNMVAVGSIPLTWCTTRCGEVQLCGLHRNQTDWEMSISKPKTAARWSGDAQKPGTFGEMVRSVMRKNRSWVWDVMGVHLDFTTGHVGNSQICPSPVRNMVISGLQKPRCLKWIVDSLAYHPPFSPSFCPNRIANRMLKLGPPTGTNSNPCTVFWKLVNKQWSPKIKRRYWIAVVLNCASPTGLLICWWWNLTEMSPSW